MSTQTDAVTCEFRDGVAVITLNRPESRNALTDEVTQGLLAALDAVSRSSGTAAAILTGAGPAFCAGGNVKEMRDRTGYFGGTPAEMVDKYRAGLQRVPRTLYEIDVPVVAAVNGPATGAGLDIAAMCDVRIASEGATFAETFVRLGLVSGVGGNWVLPRAVGRARAAELAFTADIIDAQTALEWGLVSRVVPAEDLMVEALAIAGRIAGHPVEALRMTKRLMREGERSGLDAHLETTAAFQAVVQHTEGHVASVARFFAGRDGRVAR